MATVCNVRRLVRDDAFSWATLRREALAAHPLAFGSVPDDPKFLIEFILTILDATEESSVFGAFADKAIVGIVGIRRETGKKERHKSSLWGMYVSAGYRHGGIGEMLLRAAIQEARSWSYPQVELVHLSVSEIAMEARRLYERIGFQAWGCEPRALCWEGRYADEIHMVLDLYQQ